MRKETLSKKEKTVTEAAEVVTEIVTEVVDHTKPDPELKAFFRNPERFADVFNGACFGGEQVLKTSQSLTIPCPCEAWCMTA